MSGMFALIALVGVIIVVFAVQGKSEERYGALHRIRTAEAERIKKTFHAKFGNRHGSRSIE